MEIEGAWWLMEEESPFNETSTPVVELWGGKAVWIRSGKTGSYRLEGDVLIIDSTLPGDDAHDCYEERIVCRIGTDPAQLGGSALFSCGPMPARVANDEELPDDLLCSAITLVRDSHQARLRLSAMGKNHLQAAE